MNYVETKVEEELSFVYEDSRPNWNKERVEEFEFDTRKDRIDEVKIDFRIENEDQFEFEEKEMTLERYVKSKVDDESRKQEEIETIHDHCRKSEKDLFLINIKPQKIEVEDMKVEEGLSFEFEDKRPDWIKEEVEDFKFDTRKDRIGEIKIDFRVANDEQTDFKEKKMTIERYVKIKKI